MRTLSLLMAAALLTSCATITTHHLETIGVSSQTAGSTARIDCAGTSIPATALPATMQLSRKAKECRVIVTSPGLAEQTFALERVPNNRIWWNFGIGIVVGAAAGTAAAESSFLCDNPDGCDSNSNSTSLVNAFVWTGIPMLIDYWSGAMYRHEPAKIEAK